MNPGSALHFVARPGLLAGRTDRTPGRLQQVASPKGRIVERIGVVGAGLMGAKIALVFALAGHEVLLNDRDAGALDCAWEAKTDQAG